MSITLDDVRRRGPKFRCNDCRTTAGCERHAVFMCETCGLPTHWSDGANDDRPNDCSRCWLAWWIPREQLARALAELLETIC
jgi:hypothetical protein